MVNQYKIYKIKFFNLLVTDCGIESSGNKDEVWRELGRK